MTDAPFQDRVQPWMNACFGQEISGDKLERGDRFIEEAFELLQSGGYPRERIASLAAYVWSRDIGEPAQEVGGVMVTLAAYCLAHGLDMHEAGETELARVWTKVEKIRAKQAAKPTGSALPQAWSAPADDDATIARLTAERDKWRNDCLDANASELSLRKRAEKAEAALEQARDAGFREGIEAAAMVADDHTPAKHGGGTLAAHVTGATIASAIRALSPTPQADPCADKGGE